MYMSSFLRPWETWVALLSALCIAAHLVLRFGSSASPEMVLIPLWIAILLGGLPVVFDLGKKAFAGDFGSDLLAGISIVTAVLLGEHLVAAIVILMLTGGATLEQYATRRASAVLDALARRVPQIAHRKVQGHIVDIPLAEVAIGDTLIVMPHEICPVDGVVVEGRCVMDESYLTGEPFMMSKAPGSQVLSGAVNGDSAITIKAEKLAVDSRYARIMQVMETSQTNRPKIRRIADRIGAWYTPLAVATGIAGWAASGAPDRFLSVMVIATPCPLLIAIPVAIIGAISLAARRGMIVKNPQVLEQIDTCRTFIFDKTGTLTYGRPELTEIVCAPGFDRELVLRRAASLEQYSKHPLARAVIDAAKREGLAFVYVDNVNEKPGDGMYGTVRGLPMWITGRNVLASQGRPLPDGLPELKSGLECLVFIDGEYAASLRFHDEPRKDSKSFVGHLGPRHDVDKVMLLSGDRESEVRYLAEIVGITEVYFSKSPEEKVAIVAAEVKKQRTLFVGDGINDAPAMLVATVGLAFGQNSDITSEAAGAVVLEPSLKKIDELIHIGRRMRRIALQSALGGMGLSMVGMILAALGYLPPITGAVLQEVLDIAAVLNAVRVAIPMEEMTDY
jgi:heavy metal translocating P-type ATPase